MKVALFGGSFNPIHNGHLRIADEIIKKNITDKIWFIPCGNHPFYKELINGKDRINMIKLAIEQNPRLAVLDLEIKPEKVSFTSETINILKNKFKKTEFYFILGADNLENLHKWHNFFYIKENIKFILVKRSGFELANQNIKINYVLERKSEISSTKIRSLLSKNKSITLLVPKKVENYIKQEGLYHGILCKSR